MTRSYWSCGACGQVWFRCGCSAPEPIATGDIPAVGRTNRTLAPRLAQVASEADLPALLQDPTVWEWLAHEVGPAEAAYGSALYSPPRHTAYLSGALTPLVKANVHRDDLGVLIQPGSFGPGQLPPGAIYAADNGCFSQGAAFDVEAWKRWVATLPVEGCLFVVAPDVFDPVAGRGDPVATWERSAGLFPFIRSLGHRAALVAQDGLERLPVDWDAFDALFVGGSTSWKLGAGVRELGDQARAHGLWTHIGRVNSRKRLFYAHSAGFDSVDGTLLTFGPEVNGAKLLGWLDDLNATHARGERQVLNQLALGLG